jgi:CRISPR-associated protein (TIGR02584 family)
MAGNNMIAGSAAMAEPADYKSRVLLAVSGLTPQIVAETVYWLACQRRPAFMPTRVVVITTTEGAKRVKLLLQGGEPGWLGQLSRDYGLPPIPLADEDVVVITDANDRPLDDLRTEADNTAAADTIVRAVSELTRDDASALHVSIAGGRKTQGFFAGYALSLYGRRQDRLSHVLVSSEFETHPQFFYPTPYSRVIMTRDNRPLDCRDAEVSLADLPFVRMRDGLSDALRTGRTSYASAVEAAQGRFAPPRLVIDLGQLTVAAAGRPIRITRANLAFYVWLARKARAGNPLISKRELDEPQTAQSHARDYLADYARFVDLNENQDQIQSLQRDGIDYETFKNRCTKLNNYLRTRLLDVDPQRYMVGRQGKRGAYSWGLALPSHAITIIE